MPQATSSSATTKGARAKNLTPDVGKIAEVSPADFLRVTRYLSTEVLVERDLELRILVLALLSNTNCHLGGPPGIAKSLGLRELAKCVTHEGAPLNECGLYFEKQLNANLPSDAVIGGYDMEAFSQGNGLHRNPEGFLPKAAFGFLDEWFRANGPMLDALLPIANTEERQYEENGVPGKASLRVLVSASNHLPDPDNEQAQALVDRITLMCFVDRVKQADSFKEILRRSQARRLGERTGAIKRETITLAQIDQAQAEVDAVRLTPEFEDAITKLRGEAATEGLGVSDRRWVELTRVCRAQAWMNERDHVIAEDLAVTEFGMARDTEQAKVAHGLVLPFHGRYEREATEKRQEAAKPLANVEEIRPIVDGTPPNEELDQQTMTKAINASRAIQRVKQRVEAVLKEAEAEKRDAANLRALDNELLAVLKWFESNALPSGL